MSGVVSLVRQCYFIYSFCFVETEAEEGAASLEDEENGLEKLLLDIIKNQDCENLS